MGGWAAETRWQRTGGHGFPTNVPLTPEHVLSQWDVFTNFGACRARVEMGNMAADRCAIGRGWSGDVPDDVGRGDGDAHGQLGQYGRACQVEIVMGCLGRVVLVCVM